VYPPLQSVVTAFSNRTSVALLDGLIVAVAVSWLGFLIADMRSRKTARLNRVVRRAMIRTVTLGAALYLVFLATWGLHYRRVPLQTKLRFDGASVTPRAQLGLATTAVAALNRLAQANDAPVLSVVGPTIDASLVRAFEDAQRQLGVSRFAEPGRPKRSLLLDWYFRRAAVDGMTDPYFLETMVLSDVLPVEQPMVVAHEWAHLSGYADEGDANFVGWLTCLHGSTAAQYSGWLLLYTEAARGLEVAERDRMAQQLGPGPRADLLAIRDRLARTVSPAISTASWRVYDRYLKMNRVDRGTESYADVVRLILGTRLGTSSIGRGAHAEAGATGPASRAR
jgi:hypothetical protein